MNHDKFTNIAFSSLQRCAPGILDMAYVVYICIVYT